MTAPAITGSADDSNTSETVRRERADDAISAAAAHSRSREWKGKDGQADDRDRALLQQMRAAGAAQMSNAGNYASSTPSRLQLAMPLPPRSDPAAAEASARLLDWNGGGVLGGEGWDRRPDQLPLSPRAAAMLAGSSTPASAIPSRNNLILGANSTTRGSLTSLNNGAWHPPAGPAPGDPAAPPLKGRRRPPPGNLAQQPQQNQSESQLAQRSDAPVSLTPRGKLGPIRPAAGSDRALSSLTAAAGQRQQNRVRSSTSPQFPFQPISTTFSPPPAPGAAIATGTVGTTESRHRRTRSDPDRGRGDDNEAKNSVARSDNTINEGDERSRPPTAAATPAIATKQESTSTIGRSYQPSSTMQDPARRTTQIQYDDPPAPRGRQRPTRLSEQEAARMREAADGRIDDILRESERRGGDHRRVASARTPKEQADLKGGRGKVFGMSVSAEEREKERLVAIRAMGLFEIGRDPRLDVVTSLTARLLNSEVCMITIVDHSTVYWWSVCDRGGYLSPEVSRESRSDSFCHLAIRDDKRGGLVILDANQEQRFKSKPMASRGLGFYAGAPLVISGGIRVGALSIRGAPRTSFTSEEAEILRQMAEWAVGEIEILQLRREQEVNESFQSAKWRLCELEKETNWEEDNARQILAKALEITRNALKAKNIIILKVNTASDGSISGIVHSLATECQLNLGDEKFTEIVLGCLEKAISTPLILDPQPVSIQLNVGRFVGQDVLRSASELIWSSNRPVAVLVAFFAGRFRAITQLEEHFLSTAATVFSTIWTNTESTQTLTSLLSPTHGAQLLKEHLVFVMSRARHHYGRPRKSSSISSTSISSIIAAVQQRSDVPTVFAHPAVVVIEPVMPAFEAASAPTARPSMQNLASHTMSSAVKGMEQAHAVAAKRGARMPAMTGIGMHETKRDKGDVGSCGLRPRGCVELLADFAEMLNVLAKQHGIQTVWQSGNLFMAIAGIESSGPVTTSEDLISLVLDLSLTLTEYGEETGVHVRARVGVHGDAIPTDLVDDTAGMEAAWASIAYHLSQVSHSSSILVSDNIHTATCSTHRYLPRGTVFTLGHGATGAHVLVGPKLFEAEDGMDDDDSFRGGAGDGMLGVAARVRRARELKEAKRIQEELDFANNADGLVEVKTVKSRACEIM